MTIGTARELFGGSFVLVGMPRKPRLDYPGHFFHITARGNYRQTIFFGRDDWEHFISRVIKVKAAQPFTLHAYCLMSNHLHLLIETQEAPLKKIMQLLLLAYAKYLNARLERTGHVFQAPYDSRLCSRDSYLQELVRYIHLNPVRAGAAEDPGGWPYSSHLEYLGLASRQIADTSLVLSMFDEDVLKARKAYCTFMMDRLGRPLRDTMPLEMPSEIESAPRVALPRLIPLAKPLSELEADVIGAQAFPADSIRIASRRRDVCRARRAFIGGAFKLGYSSTEIAAYLSVSVSYVSKVWRDWAP